MPITLAVGGTTVNLPDDLRWANEFEWNAVEQSSKRTVTGALVVSTAVRLIGRPITLAPVADDSAWTPRSVLEQCRTWAEVAGQQMVLTILGVSRTVIFDHAAGALSVNPIAHYNTTDATDWFRVTYKFLEVA